MSIWMVFLLSGPALGYGVIMPSMLLHRCGHPVIIPATALVGSRAETAFLAVFCRDLPSLQDFLPRCQEAIVRVWSSGGAHTHEGCVSLRKIQDGITKVWGVT